MGKNDGLCLERRYMAIHIDKQGKAKCGATPYSRYGWLNLTTDKSKANCKRCLGTVKRTVQPKVIKENMVGKIFHTSWGYDMTINQYAKVIKQSPKSILLQECVAEVRDDYGRGAGRAKTSGHLKKDGDQFRLYKKVTPYGERWAGGGQCRYWSEWDGTESYHNTWD